MSETLEDIVNNKKDPQHRMYLTFVLGEDVFGIDIRFVSQIMELQKK